MSRAPSIPNTSQIQRYHDFVAGLRKTSPVETEFEVGQIVAYVNDYGVIFEGHEIMGFADDDSFYGKFIHLNTDCYWCEVAPYSLRPYDEDGEFEIREGEVVYERLSI